MKNKIKLTAVLFTAMFIFHGCSKDDNSTSSGSGGNGGGGGGGGSTTGKVTISASWTTNYVSCNPAYTVVIGLGYNSTDIANEAYFASSSYIYSPASFSKDGLAAGTYYYKAKKTYNASTCGTGQGIPPVVTKSGAFTITAGQTTTVSAGSLN